MSPHPCYSGAMKYATLIWLLALAMPGLAAAPNEADYPAQYAVVNTIKVGSFMIGKFCTMSLRDQAVPTVAFIVQRRGYGGCHVWDAGTVFHGRREKNSIKLLTKDDKGGLKVEDWPITGSVAISPPPSQ
jgi:hypothetical protein